MTARRAQHPAGHKPVPVRDQLGSLECLTCGHTFDWGDTGRSIGSLSLGHHVVNQIVQHVPEPIAALDDDDFATVWGFGA